VRAIPRFEGRFRLRWAATGLHSRTATIGAGP
jgi:hypothetical protein